MVQHADIDHTGLTGVGETGTAAHIADATDAHDASAISVLDTATNFTGTDVEAVLAELQDNIDAVGGGSFDPDVHMPWLISIDPFMDATNTNWDGFSASASHIHGTTKISDGTQNDEISWEIGLAAGTWDIQVMHNTGTNRGIYTVLFEGASQGTFDGYAASPAFNVRSSLTGLVVATTGVKTVALRMATKNASSSAYFGLINGVRLMRTA